MAESGEIPMQEKVILDGETVPTMKNEHWEMYRNVYMAKTRQENIEAYKIWSVAYEQSQQENGWQAPQMAARLLWRHMNNESGLGVPSEPWSILDVGAGTGLVGLALRDLARAQEKAATTTIHAFDQSADMLKVAAAKEGVYDAIVEGSVEEAADHALLKGHGLFSHAICVGSVNVGHIEVESIVTMLRLVQANGMLVVTLRSGVWRAARAVIDKAIERGQCRVVEMYTTARAVRDDIHVHVCIQRLA